MAKIRLLTYKNYSFNPSPLIEVNLEDEDGTTAAVGFAVTEEVGTELINLFRDNMLDELGELMEGLLPPTDDEIEQARELAAVHEAEGHSPEGNKPIEEGSGS